MYSCQPYCLFSEIREELGSQDPTISPQESEIRSLIHRSPSAVTTAEHSFSLGLRNTCECMFFLTQG